MKKVLPLLFFALLSLSLASGQMMWGDCPMLGNNMFWTGVTGLIYFAIIAFVFSAIFWLTHNWLVKGKFK